jgi:hypothetical protein
MHERRVLGERACCGSPLFSETRLWLVDAHRMRDTYDGDRWIELGRLRAELALRCADAGCGLDSAAMGAVTACLL